MGIGAIVTCCYLAIGLILALYWWNTVEKVQYDELKANGEEVEDSMVIIMLLFFMVAWPLKLLVDVIRGLTRKQ